MKQMKKKVLTAIIAIFALCLQANAQWFVGGYVRMDSYISNEGVSTIDISPDVGYTFGRWSVGVAFNSYVSFYFGKSFTSYNIGADPYAEYYFPINDFLSFFIEGGLGLRYHKYVEEGFDYGYFNFIPYAAPGIEFMLSDHWSILGHIGRLQWDNHQKNISFSAEGQALSMGLYYNF